MVFTDLHGVRLIDWHVFFASLGIDPNPSFLDKDLLRWVLVRLDQIGRFAIANTFLRGLTQAVVQFLELPEQIVFDGDTCRCDRALVVKG